jgi:hypothetical protein
MTHESHVAVHDPSVALHRYNRTELLSRHGAILQEYNSFRARHAAIPTFGELDPVQKPLGPWQTLWLQLYGTKSCVAHEFPVTLAAIRASGLPAVSVMLSRLAPGQRLPAHFGPTRAILRYHVGLSIPIPTNNPPLAVTAETEASSGRPPHLSVWPCAGSPPYTYDRRKPCQPQVLAWRQNGTDIYFDDSYWHAADNPTDHERIILWLDLERHDLRDTRARLLNALVLAVLQWFPPANIVQNIARTNELCGGRESSSS